MTTADRVRQIAETSAVVVQRWNAFSLVGRVYWYQDLTAARAVELLAPIDAPEIWCAGVTYERSRDARVEEAVGARIFKVGETKGP